MAPSEAICITSRRPFANSLWPGGGHSPRLACCGEGWQRKPRQPSSVRNWGDFSAILTNESCGMEVWRREVLRGPHHDANPSEERALPRLMEANE
jgi:hypothetical protein